MSQLILPGNATPAQVLANQKFCAGTNYNVAGTMPENGQKILVPSGTATVPIPAGHHDGTGYVQQVNVPAASVLTGTTIAGVNGTMPENGALGRITPGTADIAIPAGHTTGGTVAGDANLLAANILAGISIFGVAGSAGRSASGTATSGASPQNFNMQSGTNSVYPLTVSGLAFTPKRIIIWNNGQNYAEIGVYDADDHLDGYTNVHYMDGNSMYTSTAPLSVANGAFTLPVLQNVNTYKWFAYEI